MIHGIDCSNWQGVINWAAVAAAGYSFGLVKATEGVGVVGMPALGTLRAPLRTGRSTSFAPAALHATYQDPTFAQNFVGMGTQGMGRAAYHFALPARNTAAAEAAYYIAYVKPHLKPGDILILDFEDDPYGGTLPHDCGPWAHEWLSFVETAFGCKPLLYTDLDLIQNRGLGAIAADGNGLWLAAPGVADPNPAPWTTMAIQQTDWHGRVPGVSGECDLDTFFGTLSQFKLYGLPQTAPGPVVVPPVTVPKHMTNDDLISIQRLLMGESPAYQQDPVGAIARIEDAAGL